MHKGIGIGPGQKYVSERELEKQEADAATQMPAVLAKTAVARPIGRDNVGKRMLEGMGWKEVRPTCFSSLTLVSAICSPSLGPLHTRALGV